MIVTYSADTQDKAAVELEALPVDSVIAEFIRDYGQLRDQIRKCKG